MGLRLLLPAALLLCACQTNPGSFSSDYETEFKAAQQLLAAGDQDRAFSMYSELADSGSGLAQFTLALFHQNGWGRPVDPQLACQRFAQAADQQIVAAEHFYASCLENGTLGKGSFRDAIHWYEKAAEHGHRISACNIAKLLVDNKQPADEIKLQFDRCATLADAGNIPAQLQTGQLYLNRKAPFFDPGIAKTWFAKAAQRNSSTAKYFLGEVARTFDNDRRLATYWFEAAAAEGYRPAYWPTAKLYFEAPPMPGNGLPTPENLAKSYLWLNAVVKLSEDAAEVERAGAMLARVKTLMPESWMEKLDEKIEAHVRKVGGGGTGNPVSLVR